MEIAVVFESMFGVTHEVADAIAEGVAEAQPDAAVTCLRVGDADPDRVAAADLVIVGGPTHMRGMSSGMSRKMAVRSRRRRSRRTAGRWATAWSPAPRATVSADWFHRLPKGATGRPAAAFDTRGEGPMVGGAAKGIAHRLESHGYELVAEPEGFIVEGDAGLLKAGERERARIWAAALVREAAAAGPLTDEHSGAGGIRPVARPDAAFPERPGLVGGRAATAGQPPTTTGAAEVRSRSGRYSPAAGRAVHRGPVGESGLGRVAVGVVAGPRAQDRCLKRASEGEAQLPGLRAAAGSARPGSPWPRVGLAAGQEHDPGHRRGHGLAQDPDRRRRDLVGIGPVRAVLARQRPCSA